jgi:hypothetical protein
MVERGGFEPPKAAPADLQSAPFDRSGTSPDSGAPIQQNMWSTLLPQFRRASEGNRTPDPLITSQLLYHLSYAGLSQKIVNNKSMLTKKVLQWTLTANIRQLRHEGGY